jgi:hypothetical protein
VKWPAQGGARGAALRALRRLYRSFRHEKTPDGRAERLLRQWLKREQFAQFMAHGYFDVTGNHSGGQYRIYHCGRVANVRVLDAQGRPEAGLCFFPVGELPSADVMLAQKIALETDERGALRVANRFLSNTVPPRRVNRRWG